MTDNLRNHDFTLPADLRDLDELREVLNDKLRRIGEALESQNGLRGTVKLGADIDMNGFRIINAGQPKEPGDLITKDNAEKNYGYSMIKQLLESFALDPTKFDDADDLYDEFIPEQVTNVSVKWKKKAGWKWFWEPPGGAARIVGYYIWLFNGSNFMHPEDGTIVGTQASAERFTERNVFSTDISLDELVAPFSTTGIRASIQAVVKIKGIGRVRGKIYTHPLLVAPGADPANGEDVDIVNWVSTNISATSPQAGLVARWKKRGLRIKFAVPTFVVGTTNPVRSALKYGIVLANSGNTAFFDPDNPGNTSASEVEYITSNNVMTLEFDRAEVHSNFQTGLKFKVRVYNVKTGGVIGISPYTAYSAVAAPGGDVLVEDTAQAEAVQNLSLVWGRRKKGFKATWERPIGATHWTSVKGFKVVFFNSAGSIFMNPDTGGIAASEADATRIIASSPFTTGLTYAELDTAFQAGVKVKVTPVNVVLGADTDGISTTVGPVAPGQDITPIATGVLTLPMGLERRNNGNTGIANTTTTYQLDTGASNENDYYNGMVLYIAGMAAKSDRVRTIIDYDGVNKVVTVGVAWTTPPGAPVAFEIHKGAALGEKSGTQTGSTTTVVLGAAADGVSDDIYNGYTLYFPAAAAADRIRRITDYVAATKTATLESAVGVAVATADPYMLWQGSVGYEFSNQTGSASGVPFRLYKDSSTGEGATAGWDINVVEAILGTGPEWYTAEDMNVQVVRFSTGIVKKNKTIRLADSTTFEFTAPDPVAFPGIYTPCVRLRFRNPYRLQGSDGWSEFSFYVVGFQKATSGTPNYDPNAFPPVEVDRYETGNWF
jgi:hypothetical protein